MEQEKFISDEDFMKSYSSKNEFIARSDKYVKGKNNPAVKIGYWIFLAVAFLAAYYFFSEYYFVPM